ncbi:MAG: DUF4834 family protein [Bacteroidaceae bacterium]|nr:DUF4834 family protein [Bacteroidaceae bacterium]
MLDFLFWTLIIILILILLIPAVLAGLGVGILRHFSREMNDAKEQQKQRSKSRFSWGSSRRSKQTSPDSRQKVFSADEGTYVDFEEV